MRHLQKAVLVSSLLAATSAMAADPSPVTANVALTTNYVWRGITQTAENPAMQGGFDFASKGGFYLGTWGSNLNWGNDAVTSADGDGASIEVDIYGGYKFKAGPLDMDVGFINYRYPGANSSLKYDFTEIYVGAGYGPFSAKVYRASDFQGTATSNSATYLDLSATFDLKVATLSLHAGQSSGQGIKDTFNGKTYTDYKIALSKDIGGYSFSLAYTDTNLSGVNEVKKGTFANDGMFMLTVSKSM